MAERTAPPTTAKNIVKRDKKLIFECIKAFQRHYRKDLIDGLIDQECLIISNNLIKNL